MTIDEAKKQLEDFCEAFENLYEKYHHKSSKVENDYLATKVLLAYIEGLEEDSRISKSSQE